MFLSFFFKMGLTYAVFGSSEYLFFFYLKGRNFRGKKISRVSRISLEFVKLNSRENFEFSKFAKNLDFLNLQNQILPKNFIFCNSRNSIFAKKFFFFWFAKLSSCKKNLFFLCQISMVKVPPSLYCHYCHSHLIIKGNS